MVEGVQEGPVLVGTFFNRELSVALHHLLRSDWSTWDFLLVHGVQRRDGA